MKGNDFRKLVVEVNMDGGGETSFQGYVAEAW